MHAERRVRIVRLGMRLAIFRLADRAEFDRRRSRRLRVGAVRGGRESWRRRLIRRNGDRCRQPRCDGLRIRRRFRLCLGFGLVGLVFGSFSLAAVGGVVAGVAGARCRRRETDGRTELRRGQALTSIAPAFESAADFSDWSADKARADRSSPAAPRPRRQQTSRRQPAASRRRATRPDKGARALHVRRQPP